jgi:hypothetical protein
VPTRIFHIGIVACTYRNRQPAHHGADRLLSSNHADKLVAWVVTQGFPW